MLFSKTWKPVYISYRKQKTGTPHPRRETSSSLWGLFSCRPQVTLAISTRSEDRPAACVCVCVRGGSSEYEYSSFIIPPPLWPHAVLSFSGSAIVLSFSMLDGHHVRSHLSYRCNMEANSHVLRSSDSIINESLSVNMAECKFSTFLEHCHGLDACFDAVFCF